MDAQGLRRRPMETGPPATAAGTAKPSPLERSPGKPGKSIQTVRLTFLALYFFASCICLHFQQFLGLPLYWHNQDWYYAWQALTKQYFGLLLVTVQEWWAPTRVRITGDKSVAGQIHALPNGRVRLDFPERLVMISNHQIYTDWLFIWWAAFTCNMHGHFYIILKDSLRYIPLLGPGMMFFSFLFLARKWETDKPRFQHRLRKLKTTHKGPLSGSSDLDPMWLLIFPEGTTLSTTGREASAKWAAKTGIEDVKHTLLPRSRGLQLCLQELAGTIEYVYDCTVAYDDIPPGQYGQDYYTLHRTYMEGRSPSFVNMHWRRFLLTSIPVADAAAFDAWLLARWREKDVLLEYHAQHGCFPLDEEAIVVEGYGVDHVNVNGNGKPANGTVVAVKGENVTQRRAGEPVCASVSPNSPLEFVQIFVSILAVPILWRVVAYLYRVVRVVLLVASLGQVRI